MFILYVTWEAPVLIAVQEGNAVGWMTKESSINFWQEKGFLSSSKLPGHPASCSVCAQGKLTGPGSKPLISV
jgi:hypothetical protein